MSIIDIVLSVLILAGAYSGYKDGFVVSLFSFLAILLGVLGGFKLMGLAIVLLGKNYNFDSSFIPYIAFALVFVIIIIVVNLAGRIIKMLIQRSLLGVADQLAGAAFGVAKAAFMLSVIIWIIDSLKINLPEEATANSWLLSAIADFGINMTQWIALVLPFFGDALSASSG